MATGGPARHTLDAIALVHEAWLRLGGGSFATRSGFFRAAARAMRRILVDHARGRAAAKRGSATGRSRCSEVGEATRTPRAGTPAAAWGGGCYRVAGYLSFSSFTRFSVMTEATSRSALNSAG